MTFKKGQKPPKKGQKISEVEIKETKPEVIEEETPVTTVVENEIKEIEAPKVEKSEVRGEIVGNGTKTTVTKPKGTISFEAQQASVPMFMIPADIRQYLINKGFGTNVWRRDKEWLERHGADMKMIEKLKKFLSGQL